jgi:hypothetical protein
VSTIGTITWAELGCPTEPTSITVAGMTFEVEDRHIKAAEGEPFATFRIIEFRPINAPAQHKLGTRID